MFEFFSKSCVELWLKAESPEEEYKKIDFS